MVEFQSFRFVNSHYLHRVSLGIRSRRYEAVCNSGFKVAKVFQAASDFAGLQDFEKSLDAVQFCVSSN